MKISSWRKTRKFYFWDRLNVLRASILGANDGIISVSGIVLGAAGANMDSRTLLVSGVSGMLAGVCSMAGGEWMSVSTQHDLQEKALEQQGGIVDNGHGDHVQLRKKDLLMPVHAAITSFVSFILGALIPLIAITQSSDNWRVINTAIAMVISLCLNAFVSSSGTRISTRKTILRNVIIGTFTILVTFILGSVFSL